MPLKLNVGLSKKIGLPDYGSLGAFCHVELELNNGLLDGGPSGFQAEAQRSFAACRQAVDDELARRRTDGADEEPKQIHAPKNSNGSPPTGNPAHRASGKQLSYIEQLAGEIRDLGARRLEGLAQKMFNKPLADLSSLDASTLIDTLKQVKSGKIDLDAGGKGAAA
ncbi:MAG TPA: hypothetical protein VND64_30225 [Pirellulales bacterium]|nr:hypothetical protein [Pirellulales bacterium]